MWDLAQHENTGSRGKEGRRKEEEKRKKRGRKEEEKRKRKGRKDEEKRKKGGNTSRVFVLNLAL